MGEMVASDRSDMMDSFFCGDPPEILTLRFQDKAVKYGLLINAVREVRTNGNGVGTCHCSECGSSVNPNDRFCRMCGSYLSDTNYRTVP